MLTTSERINKLAKQFNLKTYLEIGVRKGETFLNVALPHKTGVDPNFAFDTQKHTTPLITYFNITSDEFFENFQSISKTTPYKKGENIFTFDIIYIDGLHTFSQSYKDFKNSLLCSNKNTIWILDDTIPSDPYSAYPNQEKSLEYRNCAKLSGKPWHGDVYKTIFAIHDFHPEFSYCTHIDSGNPQTIIWKTESTDREKIFGDLEKINNLSYFDMLSYAHILMPVSDMLTFEMIGLELNPIKYKTGDEYKKIIKRVKSQNELLYLQKISTLENQK